MGAVERGGRVKARAVKKEEMTAADMVRLVKAVFLRFGAFAPRAIRGIFPANTPEALPLLLDLFWGDTCPVFQSC